MTLESFTTFLSGQAGFFAVVLTLLVAFAVVGLIIDTVAGAFR